MDGLEAREGSQSAPIARGPTTATAPRARARATNPPKDSTMNPISNDPEYLRMRADHVAHMTASAERQAKKLRDAGHHEHAEAVMHNLAVGLAAIEAFERELARIPNH